MNNVERLHERFNHIPGLDETGPAKGFNSRTMSRLALRSRLIWAVCSLVGIIPLILTLCSVSISPQLVAMGFGFLVPGGGFMACGGILTMALGLVCLYLWRKKGQLLQIKYGSGIGILGFWILGILGGLLAHPALAGYLILTTRAEHPFWGWLLAIISACLLWGGYERHVRKSYRQIGEARRIRAGFFDEALDDLRRASDNYDDSGDNERELDGEQLALIRYLLDATVREQGDFSRFDSSAGRSSYRYQFSSVGFTLMLMRAKYTPSFHGYLSQAEQFIISALTDTRTCGYWQKLNRLGYLRADPDPVKKANSHLIGWLAPVIAGYGAQTGDRRYEADGALKFRAVAKKPDKSFDYNVEGVVKSLYSQYKSGMYPYMLIPCEPNLVYTVCNAYAILGMMIYDRDHGTHYCEGISDELYKNLAENYTEADGSFALCREYLYGLRFLPELQLRYDPLTDVQNYLMYAPLFPGLCNRNYALARRQALEVRDGVTYIKGREWTDIFDMTSMKKSPALLMSQLEMVAAEYGDTEILEGLLNAERIYLKRTEDARGLKYDDASMVATANLAFARILRRGYWTDVILRGPPQASLTGPVLADCAFPDVLVAKAVSHGDDLELVLYNGAQPGKQAITVERLVPGGAYRIEETGVKFRADSDSKAVLTVDLNGRTPMHIVTEG